ncbi:hypothetical protein CEP52_014481 [Fusarium oligoseptatum]|uniref:Uncharacterized protein n=1 Tax=Fusarium oligoseptatum TaxID=2604345 RepID=A0A428SM42_9HYPO|nr:hypothetical protein CEP52_014481 [Fusarium oligoseptatum]
MVGLWNDRNSALRQGITPIIRGIDWTDIRVLRIGYDREHWTGEESEQPVTLLIEVRKDSTSWEHAYTVVVACHTVIQQCGIHDVHVEIRQPREHYFQF